MTRIISAADVSVGQTIRWTENGTTREMTVAELPVAMSNTCLTILNDVGFFEKVSPTTEVTVLKEAPIQQPNDPRRLLARAKVDDYHFVCVQYYSDNGSVWCRIEAAYVDTERPYTWVELCELGQVTILD